MRFTHLIYLLNILLLFNCKQPTSYLTKIEGKKIQIEDTMVEDPAIEAFIKPYRIHIQKDLDSVLAYAPKTYSKSDGKFNTALGNFMADAIFDMVTPIFKSRTGKNIDMVILNQGGIRSNINKGNITTRTAFELMPFENSLVVVALKGTAIDSLTSYLAKSQKAHPISKLKLIIDTNFEIVESSINGEKIDPNKIYYVAINDYIYNNGDGMTFFQPNEGLYILDYKVRNALIDNFKKVDTINPVQDDRFTQIP
ncbi:5'-nucleotidase C-terminal domain-containing protein [Mariniflexile sp. AS56]|uniref:5'-nucleotidase C-terminal domain-containing protein n=1 Tax=Mariniflexile sp. AS56 TaxID=3063957 RepID=UPI0026EA2B5A|nr:5'-nucleotidase [Mariniflexile sp. AS56]MDO7172843.1 5'-nucleotidase [Mariniflexile sp. AS56]